jgi:PAS domain S-box-containing protein
MKNRHHTAASLIARTFGSAPFNWTYSRALESEERFRLLVEGAKDYAMFLLDARGCITFWSAGATRLFGWSEAEVLGQPPHPLFLPEEREAGVSEAEMRQARETGQALDCRWHLKKDGSRFWADGLLMRLDDDAGNLRGFAKVTRDATEQKKAEDELRASEEAVRQANEDLERRVRERTGANGAACPHERDAAGTSAPVC